MRRMEVANGRLIARKLLGSWKVEMKVPRAGILHNSFIHANKMIKDKSIIMT